MNESFGTRAKKGVRESSVVRVYTRPEIPDRICYTRAWKKTSSGRPEEKYFPAGTTWEGALLAGQQMAVQRDIRLLAKKNAFGEESAPAPVTVGELLDLYAASDEAARWSGVHSKDVTYSMKFWQLRLALSKPVVRGELSPALVRGIVGEAARRLGKGPRWERKRLAHLRAAVLWGMNKKHLYEVNPLRGLEMPEYEPETDELIYSDVETKLLLTPHPGIDWRVTLLANIAADTGRRPSSILSLRVEDVMFDGVEVRLRFRKEFDKKKRARLVPISSLTAPILADALERDVVAEWGWLFPEGRLDHDDARDKPWGEQAAIDALHDAEIVVGIPYVKRRAYYGIKRQHITTSMEVAHGDTSLVGDVTGQVDPNTIRLTYRKANRKRTARHVEAVRKRIETGDPEAQTARESTHSGDAE